MPVVRMFDRNAKSHAEGSALFAMETLNSSILYTGYFGATMMMPTKRESKSKQFTLRMIFI